MAAPVSLVEQVNAITTLLLALKQEVDPNQDDQSRANELVNQLSALAAMLNALLQLPNPPGLAQRLGKAATRQGAFADIERLVSVDGGVSLALFFKQVSSAVVEAQQALDAEFDRDLRAVQTAPIEDRLPPVQYAIPSVHAEMKVGFSQISSRGVNLVVFNNSQQKQNYSESTISFDIVAAPAPPGMAKIPAAAKATDDAAAEATDDTTDDAAATAAPREMPAGAGLTTAKAREMPAGAGLVSGIHPARASRGRKAVAPPSAAAPRSGPPEPIEWLPTFPLRGQARDRALVALLQQLPAAEKRQFGAIRETAVVVPATLGREHRQPLLFLCPGSTRDSASRAQRAFRCYLGDATASGEVALMSLKRPDATGRAGARTALVIPAKVSARNRASLPDLLGGAGAALMQLIESGNACRPACVVNPEGADDARIIAEINAALPEEFPSLLDGEPWTVFIDRGARGPRHRQYIVLRAEFAPTTREWRELHAIGVSLEARRPARTPHLHIPDRATVTRVKAKSPATLEAAANRLEPLFRRLAAIIDAG